LLAVFFAPALEAAKAGLPRTGRRVQANSTILACVVEIGQWSCPKTKTCNHQRAQGNTGETRDISGLSVFSLLCENSGDFMEGLRMKRLLTVSLCLLALTLSGFAQTKKSSIKKTAAGPVPDRAFMQKIWDGWSTLDPANVAKYYATGPHAFFDIAPLKYASWDEYQAG